ncbi:hypothetical protein C4587_00475 [Candidatus Parcubacteria bacterium]|nr:MAG: hypothetical protein C4587_00475 [Candidatus Parcubacteria bacterium]
MRFRELFLSWTAVTVLLLSVPADGEAIAQSQGQTLFPEYREGIPSLDLPNISLPAPVNDFIESAQEINREVQAKAQRIDVKNLGDLRLSDRIRAFPDWFKETTGILFTDFIRGVGNLVIWFFSLITDVARWLVSLIP